MTLDSRSPMDTPDLTDRVVVVTGASGRLGREVVGQLAAAGAHVAALDLETGDAGPFSVSADATDPASLRAALDAVEAELGPPDGLVHTVGMWAGEPFAETDLEVWETVVRVNLTTTFLAFREAARRMDRGRLVAIASEQGADRGVARQAAYSAAKAGVVRLVEAVAAEYDGRITAAAVAPSTILFGDEGAGAAGVPVESVAAWCVRLCGPEADARNGEVVRAYGSAG